MAKHPSHASLCAIESNGWSGIKHATTGLSGEMFSGVKNHVMSSSFWQSNGQIQVSQLPGEQLLPDCFVSRIKFGSMRVLVWVDFQEFISIFQFQWSSALQQKKTFSACLFPPPDTVGTVGRWPLHFQYNCAPVHIARSINTWMSDSDVDKHDWSA